MTYAHVHGPIQSSACPHPGRTRGIVLSAKGLDVDGPGAEIEFSTGFSNARSIACRAGGRLKPKNLRADK